MWLMLVKQTRDSYDEKADFPLFVVKVKPVTVEIDICNSERYAVFGIDNILLVRVRPG